MDTDEEGMDADEEGILVTAVDPAPEFLADLGPA
jgi:hypothetical protein